MVFRYEAYIKKEGREETSNFYIYNFSLSVWCIECLMLISLLFIFWTSTLFGRTFSRRHVTIWECFVHIISLVTNQGAL